MSRLLLVRHAQASFLSDDYDQLSAKGEAQARALGEHWLRHNVVFDNVVIGPRRRHARTAEIARSVYSTNGNSWPQVETHAELDEHFVDQLLGEPLDKLVRLHPSLQPLAENYRTASAPDQLQPAFQRLFEAVCHLWQAGAPGTDSIDSWEAFQSRVESALRAILGRPGRNRTIAVFSSVGMISAALGSVLKCPPRQAFELGWRLKNCSVTELIFSGDRITLDQFNNVAHLSNPETWTFR
jgi:broad specificity phosphatase PhoE